MYVARCRSGEMWDVVQEPPRGLGAWHQNQWNSFRFFSSVCEFQQEMASGEMTPTICYQISSTGEHHPAIETQLVWKHQVLERPITLPGWHQRFPRARDWDLHQSAEWTGQVWGSQVLMPTFRALPVSSRENIRYLPSTDREIDHSLPCLDKSSGQPHLLVYIRVHSDVTEGDCEHTHRAPPHTGPHTPAQTQDSAINYIFLRPSSFQQIFGEFLLYAGTWSESCIGRLELVVEASADMLSVGRTLSCGGVSGRNLQVHCSKALQSKTQSFLFSFFSLCVYTQWKEELPWRSSG